MILFGIALLLVIVCLYDLKKLPLALVLFFALFDMFDGFYKDDKIFAAIRYFIPIALLTFYIIRYEVLKKSDGILLGTILYLVLFWIINSGDFLITTRNVLSVILTIIMIPVGRQLAITSTSTNELETCNRILLITIPIYIISANIFKFGESYTEAFSTGFYITSRMYLVPIVVFLAIHFSVLNKNKSWFLKAGDLLFILLNICILLINTRRTTFAMLAVALFVYLIFNRRLILKMAIMLAFTVFALLLSYPLYEAKLTAQLEKRERIQNIDTYDEEGRYLETLYIIDYFETKGELNEFLFGVKLFDTASFGIRYFGRDRPIHSDLNMFFYSTGIIGCLLFAALFLHYFFRKNSLINKESRSIYYPLLAMFLLVLIPGRFIGTLTFAPYLMLLLAFSKHTYKSTFYESPEEEEHQLLTTAYS